MVRGWRVEKQFSNDGSFRRGLVQINRQRLGGLLRSIWIVVCLSFLVVGIHNAQAVASTPAPAWQLTTTGVPSILPQGNGRRGRFIVVVENIGGTTSESGATVDDVLPPGLTATEMNGAECVGSHEITCTISEPLSAGGFATIYIGFEVTEEPPEGTKLTNTTAISGGGGTGATAETTIEVARKGERTTGALSVNSFLAEATGPAGEVIAQAASHPFLFTTSLTFNSKFTEHPTTLASPDEEIRDLVFYLPLGMLGNSTVAEQCPISLVGLTNEVEGCPPGSRIGSILPLILSTVSARERGIYNITPERGYAAEFAFTSNNINFVTYANVVRRDGQYVVRVSTPGVPSSTQLIGLVASFRGDIQEHFSRGESELTFDRGAFLTDPANCSEGAEEREASVAVDTWEHPDPTFPIGKSALAFPPLTGCGALSLKAGVSFQPETTRADEPSGYNVGLEVPQAPNDFSDLGTPPVKDTSVTLPMGTTISPSSANGLEACPAIGPHGLNIEGPESEAVAEDGLGRPVPGHCPLASQIATVKASTPLLREELTGRMYLAKPECGQGEQGCTQQDAEDGKLIGLYLELEGPNSGIVVKLEGHATVKAGTGQITASFEELPQFPFGKFVVETKRGSHAPFENSQTCGTATGEAVVTPWSPETPAARPTAEVETDWNGEGQPCPASAPLAPAFEAGTARASAATTTPFVLTLKREDREQNISTLSTTLPEGLLANISKVTRCPEPQASED